MATINIGNLTFTHKGNYDGSTAYVKNDVVYYSTNGNAYIAKQNTTGNAPTNGTYWSQFAAGSGGIWNAGLSLGSAGQVVKVNSGASALEFGTVSSEYVKLHEADDVTPASEINLNGYFKNYKIKHKAKNLIKNSLYSISEFSKIKIKDYRIISNPGCYPTSIQLALIPVEDLSLLLSSRLSS